MSGGRRKRKREYSLGRYILTGAVVGAYLGLFFHPQRGTNLMLPPILGLMAAAAIVTAQRLRGGGLQAGEWSRRFLALWVGLTLVLFGLEARHVLYEIGGRSLTLAGSVSLGMLAGWGYNRYQRDMLWPGRGKPL